eukprot:11179414-Lingulodinium_polyedra.AAC.1
MLCQNIFNERTPRDCVERDKTGFCQYHTCSDPTKLVLHTPRTIRLILDRLRAAVAAGTPKRNFEELQTRLGWNWVPNGLLNDNWLLGLCQPTESALYDWMHVFFVQGVFNVH